MTASDDLDEKPMGVPESAASQAAKHREHLVQAAQKSQEDYDKTLITLAGGALAVTFGFLKDIVGLSAGGDRTTLLVAWGCWCGSLACTLFSFLISVGALRVAIMELDAGTPPRGGWRGRYLPPVNFAAGLLFISGVVFVGCFVWQTLGARHGR